MRFGTQESSWRPDPGVRDLGMRYFFCDIAIYRSAKISVKKIHPTPVPFKNKDLRTPGRSPARYQFHFLFSSHKT
jgi:hypothetical protein